MGVLVPPSQTQLDCVGYSSFIWRRALTPVLVNPASPLTPRVMAGAHAPLVVKSPFPTVHSVPLPELKSTPAYPSELSI